MTPSSSSPRASLRRPPCAHRSPCRPRSGPRGLARPPQGAPRGPGEAPAQTNSKGESVAGRSVLQAGGPRPGRRVPQMSTTPWHPGGPGEAQRTNSKGGSVVGADEQDGSDRGPAPDGGPHSRSRAGRGLLPDAEPAEDAVEDVVGDDGADDLAEFVDGLAEVDGDELVAAAEREGRRRPSARRLGWRGRGSRGSGRRCRRAGRPSARAARRAAAIAGAEGVEARRRSRRWWRGRPGGAGPAAARSHLVRTRSRGRSVGAAGRGASGRRRGTAVEEQVGAGGLLGAEGLGAGRRSASTAGSSSRRCRPARRSGRRSRRGRRGSRGSCRRRGETRARVAAEQGVEQPALAGVRAGRRGRPGDAPRGGRGRGGGRPGRRPRPSRRRGSRPARARPSGSTSGSSTKSRLASRWASTSSRRSRSAAIGPARPPASCRRAASSCAGVRASITPSTASARVRSIRPERKARRVNSPGSACRAPRARQCARTSWTRGGEPTVWISARGCPVYVRGPGQSAIAAGSGGRRPSTRQPPRRGARRATGRGASAVGLEARQGDRPGRRARSAGRSRGTPARAGWRPRRSCRSGRGKASARASADRDRGGRTDRTASRPIVRVAQRRRPGSRRGLPRSRSLPPRRGRCSRSFSVGRGCGRSGSWRPLRGPCPRTGRTCPGAWRAPGRCRRRRRRRRCRRRRRRAASCRRRRAAGGGRRGVTLGSSRRSLICQRLLVMK